MRYLLGILLTLLLVLAPIDRSWADGNPCSDYSKNPLSNITILFVNGIGNKPSDACDSSRILRINGK